MPLAWSRGEKIAAGLIFALALTLRLLHLRENALHDPFFELPTADARLYHQWAIEIARGDWMGEGVFLLAPLYAYFLGLVYAIFGSEIQTAMIANSMLGALSCVLVVAVGRRLFDRRVAVIASALVAVDSTSISRHARDGEPGGSARPARWCSPRCGPTSLLLRRDGLG